jgi:hypothetical protein
MCLEKKKYFLIKKIGETMGNPLPWWSQLIVAVLFIGGSFLIDGLQVFLYVGLLFLAIAVFKFIKDLILNKDISAKEKVMSAIEKQEPKKEAPISIIRCPRCSAQNYTTYNFCHHCGFKLK